MKRRRTTRTDDGVSSDDEDRSVLLVRVRPGPGTEGLQHERRDGRRQTRARRLHDEMHLLMLKPHLDVLMIQLRINRLLRSNSEWDAFDLLTFLNHISEYLTGMKRFLMMEQFTVSQEQLTAQLF